MRQTAHLEDFAEEKVALSAAEEEAVQRRRVRKTQSLTNIVYAFTVQIVKIRHTHII